MSTTPSRYQRAHGSSAAIESDDADGRLWSRTRPVLRPRRALESVSVPQRATAAADPGPHHRSESGDEPAGGSPLVDVNASARDLAHILTDTIGMSGPIGPMIDHRTVSALDDGDRVLVCTNGLTDVVDEERIASGARLRASRRTSNVTPSSIWPWPPAATTTRPRSSPDIACPPSGRHRGEPRTASGCDSRRLSPSAQHRRRHRRRPGRSGCSSASGRRRCRSSRTPTSSCCR